MEPVRTPVCEEAWYQFEVQTANLNPYDLYRNTYDGALSLTGSRYETIKFKGEEVQMKRGFTMDEYTPWAKKKFSGLRSQPSTSNPILGDYVVKYANRDDVRAALHIRDDVGLFEECWNTIDYTFTEEGSIWIYPMLRHKYRILIYSGDTDGVVPTYGTRQWIT